jgi:hypothetical protein
MWRRWWRFPDVGDDLLHNKLHPLARIHLRLFLCCGEVKRAPTTLLLYLCIQIREFVYIRNDSLKAAIGENVMRRTTVNIYQSFVKLLSLSQSCLFRTHITTQSHRRRA